MNEAPTPRTDAAAIYAPIQGMIICIEGTGSYVKADFARDLERELAECREQLRLANEDALRLYNAFSYFRVPDDVDKNTGAAIRAHEARVRGEMKHDKTLR